MERSKAIKEAELTLQSFDSIEKVSAPEGFLNSVTNKIIFLEEKEQVKWSKRAKYALAAMIVLAIINVALLIGSTDDRSDYLDSIATEWNLGSSNF